MIRKVALGTAGLVLIVLAIAIAGLTCAHLEIRRFEPPLPAASAVLEAAPAGDLPVRLSYINTASQRMPRASVLEPSLDPDPEAPYTMSHPAFVLEWPDGRLFLIDAGLDPPTARSFGGPAEFVYGSDPAQPHGSAADQLGAAVQRVGGIAFTHLHTDHTTGILELCRKGPERIVVFQSPIQSDVVNFTTRGGQELISQAGCTARERLAHGPLFSIPGFPGVAVIEAAGHTPGSQILFARVRGQAGPKTWVFTGDIVNHVAGVRDNLPKPRLYSLLVVPEAPNRLDELRRYLRNLAETPGFGLLISHDQQQIEASGIPKFAPSEVR